ncbi:MAG: carboxypeptidase regulatory-like domain-containing protein [Planctomycetaceae bacterium]
MTTILRPDRLRRFFLMSALSLVVTSGGCGEKQPATYPTRGRVAFSDGKPVMLGTVELLSEDGKWNAQGAIQPDGTFVLGTFSSDDGAVAGNHKAIVMQLIISDGLPRHSMDHGDPVDPFYGSYSSSPLTASIQTSESNEITLTVERAKRR